MKTPRLAAAALFVSLTAVFATGGCVAKPTSTPIGTERASLGQAETPADRPLVILFPGYGDGAQDYFDHGFVEAMDRAGIASEVVAVDAHYGYYAKRNLLERIDADVIEPAKAAGYTRVWLVGISMGGLGALLTAQEHEELVDGVVLLSPFLGRGAVVKDIDRAGGLQAWEPRPNRDDYSTKLWSWLKQETGPQGTKGIYLAHGDEESSLKFDVLAAALPDEHVIETPGAHKWTTWERAWPELLALGTFAREPQN